MKGILLENIRDIGLNTWRYLFPGLPGTKYDAPPVPLSQEGLATPLRLLKNWLLRLLPRFHVHFCPSHYLVYLLLFFCPSLDIRYRT